MSEATLIIGDVRDVLATIPDRSVDLILTSPPFLALRSYLPPDHPDKGREIGAEPTPASFIDTLLGLSAEWRRVLAPHGSLAVELGDTYSGSGGGGGDYLPGGMREGQQQFAGSAATMRESNAAHWRQKNQRTVVDPRVKGRDKPTGWGGDPTPTGWPLAKSLCLIPELYRVGLVYGLNPLTGGESPAGRWRARNVVRWCRPNPPVGALGDKVRPATSDMVIACTSDRRWFDLDAVRTPLTDPNRTQVNGGHRRAPERGGERETNDVIVQNTAGAPPLDHWWHDDEFDQDAWMVSTEAYKGSHYATWPRALLTKPILSMCPLKVCRVCGEPSRRIVDVSYERNTDGGSTGARRDLREPDGRTDGTGQAGKAVMSRVANTTGWTDCGHNDWRPGVVLDPFAGSGTTLAVATGHGRDAIGVDLDERNVDLARERVGMFLTHRALTDLENQP